MAERETYKEKANFTDPALTPHLDGRIDMDVLAARIVAQLQRDVPKELRDLAMAAVNARKALDASIDDIGSSQSEFERVTKAAAQAVRMHRMTTVSECASMVNALKDVRQFFLGPDYERERQRLADFVELCERLQRLKDSGFLDTVADTMLRMAATDPARNP